MLFFVLLIATIGFAMISVLLTNLNDDISFFVFILAIFCGIGDFIVGILVLSSISSINSDISQMEKLKIEVMSLNATTDKNPGVIIILNDKVNEYNNLKEDGIAMRKFLILKTEKYDKMSSLVYDYDTNFVYEI